MSEMVTSLIDVLTKSGGHCIEIALACARMALGYERPLPDSWEYKLTDFDSMVTSVSKAFPNQTVSVWFNRQWWIENGKDIPSGPNLQYEERAMIRGRKNLYLFCYRRKGTHDGHMVVGWAAQQEIPEMEIYFIAAIPIEKERERH